MMSSLERREGVMVLTSRSAFPILFLVPLLCFLIACIGILYRSANKPPTEVTLTCERATQGCQLRVGDNAPASIPVGSVRSAVVRRAGGGARRFPREIVELRLAKPGGGQERTVMVCSTRQDGQSSFDLGEIVKQIDAFVGDPARPALSVHCRRAGVGSYGLTSVLLTLIVILLTLYPLMRRSPREISLVFDKAGGVVRHERRFLLGAPWSAEVPIEQVEAVEAPAVGPLKLTVLSVNLKDGRCWILEAVRDAEAQERAAEISAFLRS